MFEDYLDEVWEVVHGSIEYSNPCSPWAFIWISPLEEGLLEVQQIEEDGRPLGDIVRFERARLNEYIKKYEDVRGRHHPFPLDPGDVDDEVVDCLIQIATLGEIVYG